MDFILLIPDRYNRHDVDDTSLHTFVQKAVSQLETWKINLPAELQVNTAQDGAILPHVLMLQYDTLFCWTFPYAPSYGSPDP